MCVYWHITDLVGIIVCQAGKIVDDILVFQKLFSVHQVLAEREIFVPPVLLTILNILLIYIKKISLISLADFGKGCSIMEFYKKLKALIKA